MTPEGLFEVKEASKEDQIIYLIKKDSSFICIDLIVFGKYHKKSRNRVEIVTL